MTSQGTAHGRFTRAIKQRNLWAAETSLRELGSVSLEDALGYLDLLAERSSEKLERACVRWHGRLETEATLLSLASRSSRSPRWRASAPGSGTRSMCCGGCCGGCGRRSCRECFRTKRSELPILCRPPAG